MVLLEITHLKRTLDLSECTITVDKLNGIICCFLGSENDFYYTHNGKRMEPSDVVHDGIIHAVPRLVGGKGGFGSMLRAIGAQIEKTTNREACRDLSGRRLRDINEEKRLKNWIAQQADREREVAEKRRKKLERLCAEPKHEFQDKEYEKQRSDLSEKVWDAVDQGMKASTSGCSMPSTSQKRKLPEPKKPTKKSCLWVADIDGISSGDSDDSDEDNESMEKPSVKAVTDIKGDEDKKDIRETSDSSVDSNVHTEESSSLEESKGNSVAADDKESGSNVKRQGKVTETAQEVLAI